MSTEKLILTILLMAGVTFSTRAFPFLLFGGSSAKPPALVTYLGKYLPPAIICAILVYCFCDAPLLAPIPILKEIIAVSVVVILHLWRSNTMLSIFAGTAVYMVLTQVIFAA